MSEPKHTAIVTAPHSEVAPRMHPMVEAMMTTGPDPATLRELLAVQREWESNEARKLFTAALVRLKADLPRVIARDATVDFTSAKGRTRYTHTSLAAALEAVTPHLTEHGFALAWTPATDKGQVSVTCRLTHAGGHHEECTISAPVDTSGSKSTAQGTASTITLLQRYTALSLLGIATADMREPSGPPIDAATHVDAERNLKAVAALSKRGHSREECERLVGRPVSEWTGADLDQLRELLQHRQPGGEG